MLTKEIIQYCCVGVSLCQSPGVQSSAALALAVMSENLSSRDMIGKIGTNVINVAR